MINISTKTIKNFVMNLEGPACTYCQCENICSDLEIDHVVPASYLRNKAEKNLQTALKDPHNLYRCCRKINRKKGSLLLNPRFVGTEISGLMARSYLYMDWKYNLNFDERQLRYLNSISILNQPYSFEIRRALKISEFIGLKNPFIEKHNKD